MTETVYVVFEQQLGAYESSSEVVWQNISIYDDRSDAYEYAATVDYRFDVNVMEKTIISEDADDNDSEIEEEEDWLSEEDKDAIDSMIDSVDTEESEEEFVKQQEEFLEEESGENGNNEEREESQENGENDQEDEVDEENGDVCPKCGNEYVCKSQTAPVGNELIGGETCWINDTIVYVHSKKQKKN
jgi:hypothetical protein